MTTPVEPFARAPITPRPAAPLNPAVTALVAESTMPEPRILARLSDVSSPCPIAQSVPQATVERAPAYILPRRFRMNVPAWVSHKVALAAVAAVTLTVLIVSTRQRDTQAPLLENPPVWNEQLSQPAPVTIAPAAASLSKSPAPAPAEATSPWFREEPAARQADRRSAPPMHDSRAWEFPEERSVPSAEMRTSADAPPDMPVDYPDSAAARRIDVPGVPQVEYNRYIRPADVDRRTAGRDHNVAPRVSRRPAEAPRAQFDGTIRTPSFPSTVTPHDNARSVFH